MTCLAVGRRVPHDLGLRGAREQHSALFEGLARGGTHQRRRQLRSDAKLPGPPVDVRAHPRQVGAQIAGVHATAREHGHPAGKGHGVVAAHQKRLDANGAVANQYDGGRGFRLRWCHCCHGETSLLCARVRAVGGPGAGASREVTSVDHLNHDRLTERMGQILTGHHVRQQTLSDDSALRQQQRMTETGRDLLHVVGHQNHGGRVRVGGKLTQSRHQFLTPTQVQTSGRFVEEQQLGVGHQRTRDEYPFAFTLGQRPVRTF